MELTHDERAANGAALFDSIPEWPRDAWWKNFNLEALVSVRGCNCAADLAAYAAIRNCDGFSHIMGINRVFHWDALPFGCNSIDEDDDALMVAAWKRLIEARRAAQVTLPPKPLLARCVELALAK
jgi:hypothetical protein